MLVTRRIKSNYCNSEIHDLSVSDYLLTMFVALQWGLEDEYNVTGWKMARIAEAKKMRSACVRAMLKMRRAEVKWPYEPRCCPNLDFSKGDKYYRRGSIGCLCFCKYSFYRTPGTKHYCRKEMER